MTKSAKINENTFDLKYDVPSKDFDSFRIFEKEKSAKFKSSWGARNGTVRSCSMKNSQIKTLVILSL